MVMILVLIVLIVFILISCVKIVPQAQAVVVERLGAYLTTWNTGLHFKWPIIDRVARKISLKEQVADFPPQAVITSDNVTMQIDTIIFFQITDPKMFCYGVANPISAIEYLTSTTLRNIIGEMELDQTLTSRETINTKMRAALDKATDQWGIKVMRVELKNINPPTEVRDAMEKQAKAEREKRAVILTAEGKKESDILVAQGKKESMILEADAEKKKRILEAEGEAEAIKKVQSATAEGLVFLKNAGVNEAVLTLKSLEAFEKAADGRATKIIIPSEIQGIAGLAKSLSEVVTEEKPGKDIPKAAPSTRASSGLDGQAPLSDVDPL
ncbi:SPFH/Band 7/PHB domain protein [Ruminococcus sp. CLA-AA-H200]|uniref:SPFH/Band 7/PHB domain protein n=1 Tax=Ruminococcus turbiniformis TaxID=2881258 RepID=A0ABS8FWY4_9FIRM|nr:SPFH domain-containing protein [Ruminococcus turbiniformis]MCC2254550.1 SPFH/Band 7/PHB domain protein [Ruminococcus turbiniformis]